MKDDLLNLVSVQTLIALQYANNVYITSKDALLLSINKVTQDNKLETIVTINTIFNDVLTYRSTLDESAPIELYKALLAVLDASDDCTLYLEAH